MINKKKYKAKPSHFLLKNSDEPKSLKKKKKTLQTRQK